MYLLLLLQSLQILTPNTDARRWFTETTELTKHTNVCRRNLRNVKEVEEGGKWRTALPRRHGSPATVPLRRTFITASEWRGRRRSRGNLGIQCPLPASRRASGKPESRQVRAWKGGRAGKGWFHIVSYAVHYNLEVICYQHNSVFKNIIHLLEISLIVAELLHSKRTEGCSEIVNFRDVWHFHSNFNGADTFCVGSVLKNFIKLSKKHKGMAFVGG